MPLIESWIESANAPGCDFPLNNLPCGMFSPENGDPRCGVAIGNFVLDLHLLEAEGLLPNTGNRVFTEPSWNAHVEQGPKNWSELRERLTALLRIDGKNGVWENVDLRERAFHELGAVRLHMPFRVTEYTDFYAGRNHAANVGTMFRGANNALPPNWLHMPIGYNGRASTVVVSGTPIVRPCGQLKPPDADRPVFGPSKRLDIELEMGAVVGTGSSMSERVSVRQADEMIFGYVLLNDWSARDIQAWEYQPLGPFQGKAFATSISPWIITKAALEPFRTSAPEREFELLDYLAEPGPMLYDIALEIGLTPGGAAGETIISRTNYAEMYYSAAQQLAHHASSGCAMRSGDLLGSGTISGSERESCGSLLEISWGGETPLDLGDGITRSFLEDGDTVTLRGHAQGDGYRIGFGECRGEILPTKIPDS